MLESVYEISAPANEPSARGPLLTDTEGGKFTVTNPTFCRVLDPFPLLAVNVTV